MLIVINLLKLLVLGYYTLLASPEVKIIIIIIIKKKQKLEV